VRHENVNVFPSISLFMVLVLAMVFMCINKVEDLDGHYCIDQVPERRVPWGPWHSASMQCNP